MKPTLAQLGSTQVECSSVTAGTSLALTRRQLLAGTAAGAAALGAGVAARGETVAATQPDTPIVVPPMNHRYLLSCKLSMITNKGADGQGLSLAGRLKLAQEAGFDGVDLDEAGACTTERAREAVAESGVFVHNAIHHGHWQVRLTSANEAERKHGLENLLHCIRVSHAAGGNGVLIVVGHGNDGPMEEIVDRSIEEISKAIPLAAALGQRILFENVWNNMFYDYDKPPEQSAERWCEYVDRFNSPWVGMYHDIGNHWKYGNPGDWIRAFGARTVKYDLKGFNRKTGSFADIGLGDLPWDDVRKALDETNFTGWFTAEVGGGGLDRLKGVRGQMAKVLGMD